MRCAIGRLVLAGYHAAALVTMAVGIYFLDFPFDETLFETLRRHFHSKRPAIATCMRKVILWRSI